MSIGHIKEFDKKRLTTAATCVKPDGTHVVTVIEPVEEIEHWVSPTTGNKYPTKVVLRAPSIDCVLTVEVPYKAQEIVSTVGGVTKYEGAAIVTGTFEGEKVSGECYLELVGYWR
jgi:predicted secreted hydrolase